ncbi:hypothetical protein HK098_003168, partial [Nowakowskiella sp. JEL0407]
WNVKPGTRYVCFGTSGYQSERSGDQIFGRVLVFSLKINEILTDKKYRMRKLGEFHIPNARILSIVTYMNSYLLAAADNVLYLLKIDSNTRKLISGTQVTMRWPIHYLSTSGSLIVVGGQRESIIFYTYNTFMRRFELIKSDPIQRLTMSCLAVSEYVAVGSDKAGNVFGLVHDPKSKLGSLIPAFQFNAHEIITQLQLGNVIFSPQLEPIESGWNPVSDDSNVTGQAVYGSTLLGSVWVLLRLNEVDYKRMKLVQDILQRVDKTKPILGNSLSEFRSNDGSPLLNFIDGEFVSQFLSLSREDKEEITYSYNMIWEALEMPEDRSWTVDELESYIERFEMRCK